MIDLPKITLAHSGKQHSYLTALSLLELGFLNHFYTSSYVKNLNFQKFINNNVSYFQKRFIDGLYGDKVCSNWRFEFKEIFLRKLFGKTTIAQNAVYQRDVKFDNFLSKIISNENSNIFWGFQGSCLNTLKSAKNNKFTTIVELATAHVTEAKKILGEEQKLYPEWADSIDNLIFPYEYEKRLVEEPHIADWVFSASNFTKQSLINDGISEEKIKFLPLCFNTSAIEAGDDFKYIENRKLKVLYCGTITQRKGIKYLLDAFKSIVKNSAELHIIGNIQGSGDEFRKYSDLYTYTPGIPQNQLFKIYKNYDILVLPTIFEGFGLVIPEAMKAGLPVITTNHSFGYEIINHRNNGSIVPIRDYKTLGEEILYYASLNNDIFNKMRNEAILTADNFSRNSFRERINVLINNICQNA
ncbi:MAG: glycosyltransferase family 4 protein [Bacteroidales bacterium]|nr:glycosyltransferase family 4 protein [Bacteroidales bacterium]